MSFDRHAARDLNPPRKLAEREQTPIDVMLTAAALLETHGPQSSECRATAERLRRLSRALADAASAEVRATARAAPMPARDPRSIRHG
mgnify:CR=1 FL=1